MATVTLKLAVVLLLAVVLSVWGRTPGNECKGFSQIGEPCENGTGTCTYGVDNETWIFCAIDCDSVDDPQYGSVNISGTQFLDTASHSCDIGYVVHGNSPRYCLEDGKWSGNDTTCIPVDCGLLDGPQYGSVNISGTQFLDTASYSCDTGYVVYGDSPRTCLEDGQWSGNDTTCIPVG